MVHVMHKIVTFAHKIKHRELKVLQHLFLLLFNTVATAIVAIVDCGKESSVRSTAYYLKWPEALPDTVYENSWLFNNWART